MAAQQDEPLLARWSGPLPIEFTDDECALLDVSALAQVTKGVQPLDRWGGVLEAAKAYVPLKRRRDAAGDVGWIDGFETHVTVTLAAGTV